MFKQSLAIAVAVAAVSLAAPQTGKAGVTCNPICAPVTSNGNADGSHGLNRANEVAVEHGVQGRTNAQQKQDERKPGGSGVVVGDGGESGGGTDTGGDGTGGSDPGPCSGC